MNFVKFEIAYDTLQNKIVAKRDFLERVIIKA